MAPVDVEINLDDDDFNGFAFEGGRLDCQFGTSDNNETIGFAITDVFIQRCKYLRKWNNAEYVIKFNAGAGKKFELIFTFVDGIYSFKYRTLDEDLNTGFPIKAELYNQIAAYIEARLPAPVAPAPVVPAPVVPVAVANTTFTLLGKYFRKEITIDELDKYFETADDLNEFDHYGTNALMRVIHANDMELLERLLLNPRINVNAEKNGETALTFAVRLAIYNSAGSFVIYSKMSIIPAINLLVSKGAGVNQGVLDLLKEGFVEATRHKPHFKTDEWKICASILEIVAKIPGIDLRKVEAAALSNIFSISISQKIKEDYFYPVYSILNPTTPPFSYPGTPKPMFYHKGYSCATDALFTVLFESEEFRPFFYEKIPSGPPSTDCCILLPETETAKANINKIRKKYTFTINIHTADAEKYIGVLGVAKQRYDRMTTPTPFVSPRRGSISNNLWKGMHFPLKCDESPRGLPTYESAHFLESLLSRNILGMSGLGKYNVRFFEVRASMIPESFDFKKVRALFVHYVTIKPDEEASHMIGFYRFKDKWILADNGIGYLHEIQDTQWFNDIFLPRLKNTINDPTTTGSADKKVFFQPNHELSKFYMYCQIITIGARSYPNVPMILSEKGMYKVFSIITISREDMEETSASAAPVALAPAHNKPAGGAGNTRRDRRKMARRTRRNRKY